MGRRGYERIRRSDGVVYLSDGRDPYVATPPQVTSIVCECACGPQGPVVRRDEDALTGYYCVRCGRAAR